MKPLEISITDHTFSVRSAPMRDVTERRQHDRIETRINANVYCRGQFQSILIRNVSSGGLMMRNAFGLCIGDHVTVKTIAGRSYPGRVVWSVAPFSGMSFETTLEPDDPLFHRGYRYAPLATC